MDTSFASWEIVTTANYETRRECAEGDEFIPEPFTGSTRIFPATVVGLKSPNPIVLQGNRE